MPIVIEVPVPDSSTLLRTLKVVHFCDAYQTAVSNTTLSVQDVYEAVFGYVPSWIKILMAARGVIASALGLKHEDNAGFSRPSGCTQKEVFKIGQRVGQFSVQSIETNELIMGDNDKHLNFRISIYRSLTHGVETVTVSTAVEIHNSVGRLYMLVIKPFHRLIVRSMLQRAASSGRL